MSDPDSTIAELFRALGDPVRCLILASLSGSDEVDRRDLLRRLSLSESAMSYHAKVLMAVGLVEGRRTGRTLTYRLTPGGIADLYVAVESLVGRRRPAVQVLPEALQV